MIKVAPSGANFTTKTLRLSNPYPVYYHFL
ncbi:hypothetical protein AE42_01847 [Enterobacter kobei]|nr:hypothetical protein AE42_01847 [Enterobacter kobei]